MLTCTVRLMHTLSLHEFLADQPRGAVSSLARDLGISRIYLSQLVGRQNGRVPSPELCVVIERQTGRRVMRWNLRPDDWHLIWPELIGAEGAPAVPMIEPEVCNVA